MNSFASAPESTVMLMMKKTVLVRRSKAVAMMEFNRLADPMRHPNDPKKTESTVKNTSASTRRLRKKPEAFTRLVGAVSCRATLYRNRIAYPPLLTIVIPLRR